MPISMMRRWKERRTQAVMSRRYFGSRGGLRYRPSRSEAVDRVRAEAWPEPANADELHDALVWLGFVSADEAKTDSWREWLDELATPKTRDALAVV